MLMRLTLLLAVAWLIVVANSAWAEGDGIRYSAVTSRAYDEVLEEVEFAIGEHNFRITGGNRIGGAIGERHDIAFPRSDIIHFCNLEYARKLLEIAPDYLLYMPCKVALQERNGQVVVETWLLPEDDPRTHKIAQSVNRILKAVVNYATED